MQNGQIELDDVKLNGMPLTEEQKARITSYDKAARMKMSPDLGLPPLLESKRWPWVMVDKVFARQATFDRILVYQIDEEILNDSPIVMADETRESRRYHAARGVIVSAGLRALDVLRSNGLDLGHTVNFISACPYRLEVDFVVGKPVELLVMNVGDIVASEDSRTVLRSGVVKIICREKQHIFVDEEGNEWDPVMPWTSPDQP